MKPSFPLLSGEVTRRLSKQSEDHEKISLDPKLIGEGEHVDMSLATSVEVLEKMEKTGTFKIFLRNLFVDIPFSCIFFSTHRFLFGNCLQQL